MRAADQHDARQPEHPDRAARHGGVPAERHLQHDRHDRVDHHDHGDQAGGCAGGVDQPERDAEHEDRQVERQHAVERGQAGVPPVAERAEHREETRAPPHGGGARERHPGEDHGRNDERQRVAVHDRA